MLRDPSNGPKLSLEYRGLELRDKGETSLGKLGEVYSPLRRLGEAVGRVPSASDAGSRTLVRRAIDRRMAGEPRDTWR